MREMPTDHAASVVVNDYGVLTTTSRAINMVEEDKGGPRKLVSVLPKEGENVVNINDHRDHFARLTSLNVSLTNACNLSCSYCYEQHRKDYGRFTVESVKQAYDFLYEINDLDDKNFIFFGGEPLIHSKLILDFLRTNRDRIVGDADVMRISIVSNGLLLTPQFINEYFSYPNTNLILSIDTFDASVDQRGIGQPRLNALKASIEAIPLDARLAGRVMVRPTIGFDTARDLPTFLETLYGLGIRAYIVQPLIMGNVEGFLEWGDAEWSKLTADVRNFLRTHTDIHIEVTEGVGSRVVGNNCLSGYDIISIDPSGDFSGCFFFVNQKDAAGDLISGNIFKGMLFIDREREFDRQYRSMFEQNEQCKACHLQDHCYQCPAGNLDTGGGMYRPDKMCQRFVQFYLDIQNERFSRQWERNMNRLRADFNARGDMAFCGWLSDMMEAEFQIHLEDCGIADYSSRDGLRDRFCGMLTENTHPTSWTWDQLHDLLLVKHGRQSVRVPVKDGSNPTLMIMYLALLKTVFYN